MENNEVLPEERVDLRKETPPAKSGAAERNAPQPDLCNETKTAPHNETHGEAGTRSVFYYVNPQVVKATARAKWLLLPAVLCLVSLIGLLFYQSEYSANGNNLTALLLIFIPLILTLVLCVVVALCINPYAVQRICYVRRGERMWTIALDAMSARGRLPHINLFHVKSPSLMMREEQAVIEKLIDDELDKCECGRSVPGRAIVEMCGLRIVGQTRKKTMISYSVNGRELRKNVPNIYDGLFAQTLEASEVASGGFKAVSIVLLCLVFVFTAVPFSVSLSGWDLFAPDGLSGRFNEPDTGSWHAKTMDLTEETYQKVFQHQSEYDYIGKAYYKVYREEDDRTAYVDAYLPYGDQLTHFDEGRAVQSEAHGMRVYQTMRGGAENAEDVVDSAYQNLVDSGLDIYEGDGSQTAYDEGYDIAVRQIFYFEDNRTKPRIAILYADTRQNGYYMYAQITYLPEQFDEAQSALLEELRDVFALNLPDVPAM